MTTTDPVAAHHGGLSPSRERSLLWVLALTQFTVITDFMVMMPLSPQIMHALSIGPATFAFAVSAYSWCGGLSGLLAATYIDRFNRMRLLLAMYALFALSNLACALASGYDTLLFARAFAGLCSGVLGSLVMTVIGEAIPEARRGAAAGAVMTAFSLAAIAGVPIGTALGAYGGWRTAFYFLTLVSVLVWIAALRIVPALPANIARPSPSLGQTTSGLLALFSEPHHLRAYVLGCTVMIATMLVTPFVSSVLVANLAIEPQQISWIYMAGGIATLFTARVIGRLSDRYGKPRIFRCLALLSILPILAVTHLPKLTLTALIALFPLFTVSMSGRNIPMQALMTQVPDPSQRGAFLSVHTAVLSLGSGIGAWLGGLLLSTGPRGEILGFGDNGWLAAAMTLFAALWVSRVRYESSPKRSHVASVAACDRVT